MRIVNSFSKEKQSSFNYINTMININGKPPRLIKINGTVPDIVKINNSIVWKNAFSINFKASFYWDTTGYSSGCSDWNVEDIRLSDFTVTANHYFPHLYLDKIKIYTSTNLNENYEQSFSYGYELKSGQTYNIDESFYCGETEYDNRLIKVELYFYAAGNIGLRKIVSVSAYTDGLSRKSKPVLSTIFSDTISAFTEAEIDFINAK